VDIHEWIVDVAARRSTPRARPCNRAGVRVDRDLGRGERRAHVVDALAREPVRPGNRQLAAAGVEHTRTVRLGSQRPDEEVHAHQVGGVPRRRPRTDLGRRADLRDPTPLEERAGFAETALG
jgi:hypothetical protein